ncbi:MAG: aldehyde ferredoxin oxidoreductase N-terminal domain-containing protein [Dethiobacteria bacterium]|jgi:aldehyde:ferredoxin oxidoreductase
MRYGATGYSLEIDLSIGDIKKVEADPKLTEDYLGGLGTAAKIHWDRVPPEVQPFSPDNLLIFDTGLLVGTPAISASRAIVTAISPQTLLMAYSMMGGFWPAELKLSGYDRIIIRGKSPEWVYLWINNGKVELRDASHLLGKGTYETMESIKKELGEPRAEVAAIGLAGENKVYHASIEANRGSAGRLGLGAIMGDKKLKAIAVRGTQDINIAKPAEFIELCNEVQNYIINRVNNPIKGVDPTYFGILGTVPVNWPDEAWHFNNFAWGNARQRRKGFWTKEYGEYYESVLQKRIKRMFGCYNCPLACGALIELPDSQLYPLKCWGKMGWNFAAYIEDIDWGLNIAGRALSYGVDAFGMPQVVAFGLELYEAGILTDKDFEGMPADKGDAFVWLLDKIVRREGIGDVLANGTYWASRQIGKGAEEYAHNTNRKHEQIPIKLGMLSPIFFLWFCTDEKQTISQIEGQVPQAPLPKEHREEFVKDWIQIPTGKEEMFKKYMLEWGDPHTAPPYWPPIEVVTEICNWSEVIRYIDNTTGICSGLSGFHYKPPFHIHNYPLFITAATGMDIDEEGLWQTSRRVRNLVRCINIRRGLRRKDEAPPADHWKKRFPEYEEKLLDEYYKLKGWNEEGIPTKETFLELGLDYVYEDFVKRGILEEVKSGIV